MALHTPTDVVFVRDVAIQAKVGLDCWQREKPQPALISLRISTSVERAAQTDNIADTMDYRKMYHFLGSLDGEEFPGVFSLAHDVCHWALEDGDHRLVECTVTLPKGLLQSEGIVYELAVGKELEEGPRPTLHDVIKTSILSVKNLRINCIIGIGTHERVHKQPVIVNLKLEARDEDKQENLAADLEGIYVVCYPLAYRLLFNANLTTIALRGVIVQDFGSICVRTGTILYL
jgi:FolB domain-containing protein